MTEMSKNTKLEIAVEIIATKIVEVSSKEQYKSNERVLELIEERNEMYKDNEKIINKIINQYGSEVRNKYCKI